VKADLIPAFYAAGALEKFHDSILGSWRALKNEQPQRVTVWWSTQWIISCAQWPNWSQCN